MRVAVTGASGFLGQSILQQLIHGGHRVRALSRREPKPSNHPAADSDDLTPSVTWFRGDLNNAQEIDGWLDGCDGVIHAAFDRGDGGFMTPPDDPVAYYQTNVVGTLRLLELAVRAGVGRFVYVSSGAVHERVRDDLPLDENHPLTPASIYGAAKAACETMVDAYGQLGRIQTATIRPVSIYGIQPNFAASRYHGLLSDLVGEREVDVSGGGKVVHVDDVAAAMVFLLQTATALDGGPYPCCDQFVSHAHVADIAAQLLGRGGPRSGFAKPPGKPIDVRRLTSLGFQFGGEARLRQTIADMLRRLG